MDTQTSETHTLLTKCNVSASSYVKNSTNALIYNNTTLFTLLPSCTLKPTSGHLQVVPLDLRSYVAIVVSRTATDV